MEGFDAGNRERSERARDGASAREQRRQRARRCADPPRHVPVSIRVGCPLPVARRANENDYRLRYAAGRQPSRRVLNVFSGVFLHA